MKPHWSSIWSITRKGWVDVEPRFWGGKHLDEQCDWCGVNIVDSDWEIMSNEYTFLFKNADDATLFALKFA